VLLVRLVSPGRRVSLGRAALLVSPVRKVLPGWLGRAVLLVSRVRRV
jgi:hypothetical protein